MPNGHDEEPDDEHPVEPLDPEPAPAQPQSGVLGLIPSVVGILALIGYAVFVLLLLERVKGTPDPEWLRVLHVFTSVEAIAFAAAGFFFGREVNRARAEQAETRADQEKRRANKAVSRGNELKGALGTVADVEARARGGVRETAGPSPAAVELARLARRAERLFPS